MKRIIWGLAILIIPAFVLWGAGSSGKKKKGPGYAGKIYNRKISIDEYADMWRVTRDQAIRSFGANIPVEFIDQLAWNRLLLLEEAKRLNTPVSNEEVVERVASFPLFQRDGRFDKKIYKSILKEGARGFEEKIRDDIRISKLRENIVSNVFVSEEKIKEEYKKRFEKIKSSYLSIPFSQFEKDVTYEESDIVGFYEKNKEHFRRPDEINIRYIKISFSSFDKEVFITDDEITRHFEENTSDYKKPDSEEMPVLNEEIKKGISEKLAADRKRFLAEELGYRVLDKALDKKNLDDIAISFALQVKETGFFNMQQEIPGIGWSYDFTKKGFELRPEEIANLIIKTDDAYCIIQLKERKESYIPKFEGARDSVLDAFIKNESVRLAEKKANKSYLEITNKIKQGKSFKEAVEEIGLKLQETELITRDDYIPGLGPAGDFANTSMSLEDGEIGKPIKMLDGWVILKSEEYQGVDESKFTEEKDEFEKKIMAQKKQTAFDEWFEELKRRANFVSYTLE